MGAFYAPGLCMGCAAGTIVVSEMNELVQLGPDKAAEIVGSFTACGLVAAGELQTKLNYIKHKHLDMDQMDEHGKK